MDYVRLIFAWLLLEYLWQRSYRGYGDWSYVKFKYKLN